MRATALLVTNVRMIGNTMAVDPVRYVFLNREAQMSTGKIEAQAAHACELAALGEPKDSNLHRLYFRGGHHSKVVLLGRDHQHMQSIVAYLWARGFPTISIYDEGRTEVDHLTFTAIATYVVDKNHPHTRDAFSTFDLYKDLPKPTTVIQVNRNLSRRQTRRLREQIKNELKGNKTITLVP